MTMHCPSCGNETPIDHKFCRKCGFNLEPVVKLLGVDEAERKIDKAERDRRIMSRMVSWMMWGMLVLVIGVVVIVIGKTVPDPIVKLIGTVITLGGVSVAMYGVLDALRGGKRLQNNLTTNPGNIASTPANTTRELEAHIPVPVPSVTERTTELIGKPVDHTGK